MPKLTVNTKDSLYEPTTIEIDGKTFTAKEVTRADLKALDEFDNRIREGDLDASYQRLEFFIGSSPLIGKLPLGRVLDITNFIFKSLLVGSTAERKKQKAGESK